MRHDEHYLRLIHKHCSVAEFERIRNLPFFFLPIPDKWKIGKKVNLPALRAYVGTDIDVQHLFPFDNFAFMFTGMGRGGVPFLIHQGGSKST